MKTRTLADTYGYPTMQPIRRKLHLPSCHELHAECVRQDCREEERQRQLARKQERNGKRSQAFA